MNFIELVTRVVKIGNVKHPNIGKWKRDEFLDPIHSGLVSDWKIDFLCEFGRFIEHWEKSGSGITTDTALACKQMAAVLPATAEYLIEQRGFSYVLLGKMTSDPLENRYDQYRQMSGGNYYISMKNNGESERRLKVRSLLQLKC